MAKGGQELDITNPEIAAAQLFSEALENHHLPDALTPSIFAETMRFPSHSPVAAKFLESFGTSPHTTFRTEFHATNARPEKAAALRANYAKEWALSRTPKPTKYPVTHSPRLQTLCASHNPSWEHGGHGQKIQFIMSSVVGPALDYRFDVIGPESHDQPGDFHLLFDWMQAHIGQLEPIYFEQQTADSSAAKIAHTKWATINEQAANELLQSWESILGTVDLEAVNPKKGKAIDPTAEVFPRAGETAVSRTFRELFVDLDLIDRDAIANTLGVDAEDMGEDGHRHFARQVKTLQLIILSLIKDTSPNYRPLQKLAQNLQEPLPRLLPMLRVAASTPPSPDRKRQLSAIDPTLNNRRLSEAIVTLQSKAKKSSYPGFGAPQALLSHFTELKLASDPNADNLEKLMYLFTELIRNPKLKETLKIDDLVTVS